MSSTGPPQRRAPRAAADARVDYHVPITATTGALWIRSFRQAPRRRAPPSGLLLPLRPPDLSATCGRRTCCCPAGRAAAGICKDLWLPGTGSAHRRRRMDIFAALGPLPACTSLTAIAHQTKAHSTTFFANTVSWVAPAGATTSTHSPQQQVPSTAAVVSCSSLSRRPPPTIPTFSVKASFRVHC